MTPKEVPTVSQIVEAIFRRRSSQVKPQWLAETYDTFVWILEGNGEEVFETMQSWIRGNDQERIAVALELREAFLWNTREEMVQEFDSLTARYPRFAAACNQILARWDEQHR